MLPDFLVDVGNTSCKVMVLGSRAPGVALMGEISRHDHGEVPNELLVSGKFVLLAGSNSYILDLWKEKIVQAGAFARVLSRDDIPIKREMVDPSTVGVDRLLVCLGAQAGNGPGPHLVVDAGTALTANLVGHSGHFLGGAIGPGLGVMNQALARKATPLFEVDWEKDNPKFPASTTREAIVLGLRMAAIGFVREAWEKAREQFPVCGFHLTGRDSPLIHTALSEANLDLRLVFRGMLATINYEDNKNSLSSNKPPEGQKNGPK